ncbi:hypothetical protein GCK72_021098 [Caenorhabditis remanei]|uniref:F-box domain-containing protein n=1 Tax=Caenorhabditis remanei TaxID=31234 RepID=A0A6A5GIZ3_CAERE|nr:hypothetical protein GCK72_021098 [Caenorhabditis remanei]KAF1754535.1 hypothetical protein GCK72_021098 [Caenorhabditis remanei]
MTTAFPLLRLPYLVLMPVLEQMEFMERISLSIISKRARMFVKLLKMKCKHINLTLTGNKIEMRVFFDNSKELTLDMYVNGHTRISLNYYYYIAWWPGPLSPMDYVFPIMEVTHCKSIKQLTLARVSGYGTTIPLLAKLLKIDEVIVEDTTSYSFSPESPLQNVLKIVLPVSSAVTISAYADRTYLREIFKGNFESVTLKNYWGEIMPNFDMKLSLNDLRMTNVKSLELPCTVFKVKKLNRYFKLWMKKKCNDRLEYLRVTTGRWVNIKIKPLLKGLNAVQIPIRTDKTFRSLGNIKQFNSEDSNEEITKEFDITRADGRQATIRISDYGTISFYVWPKSTNKTTNLELNQSSFTRKFSRISNFYNSCIERFK